MHLLYVAVALLVSSATAKTCINQTIPIDIIARIAVFDENIIPQEGIQVVTFMQNLTRRGENFTETVLQGYETISGTYNISTQFCKPDESSSRKGDPVVQVLTHGIGFDKTCVYIIDCQLC